MAAYNPLVVIRAKAQSSGTFPNGQYGVFQLRGGEARRLRGAGQIIRVISGFAWITVDGEDIILQRGQEFTLAPSKYPAVISSARIRVPVVYEVLDSAREVQP